MVRADFSLLMEIVVSGLAIILVVAALNSWLASATVTVRPGGVQIDSGLPLLRRRRDIPAGGIGDIVARWSSRTGNSVCYALTALVGTDEVKIVGGVGGKETADYLAAEMKRSLGLAAMALTP
jgi:hypothetical protein